MEKLIKKFREKLYDDLLIKIDCYYDEINDIFDYCNVLCQRYNINSKKLFRESLRDIIFDNIDYERLKELMNKEKQAVLNTNIVESEIKMAEFVSFFDGNMQEYLRYTLLKNLSSFTLSLIGAYYDNENYDKIKFDYKIDDIQIKRCVSYLKKINKVKETYNYVNSSEEYYNLHLLNLISSIFELDLKTKDKVKLINYYLNKARLDLIKLSTSSENNDFYDEIKIIFDENNIDINQELSQEDINKILKSLNISPKDIDEIRLYIFNSNPSISQESSETNIKIESGIDVYSKNEERKEQLISKLQEFIDLKFMILKKFMNRKETDLIVSILKELKYDQETIKKIIFDNEVKLLKEDLIRKCEYLMPKAKYYCEKYGYKIEYNDFEEYYNGYFESTDKETKVLYYEYLQYSYDEINKILNVLPRNYEFELQNPKKGKALNLKKEED